MAALGADYPVIKEIPIELKASGRRREFDRMGEVEVPPTATGARNSVRNGRAGRRSCARPCPRSSALARTFTNWRSTAPRSGGG